MSYWVELHCDFGASKENQCQTFRGNNPGVLIQSNLETAKRILIDNAMQQGWRRIGNKWACAYCQLGRK